MKTFYITFLMTAFLGTSLFGQRDQTIIGSGGIDLTGLWGGSVNTISSFDENFDLNNGGFFVFELNKNFLIGWTGYGNEFTTNNGVPAEITNNDLLLGYNFGAYKSIHPTVNFQVGGGKLKISGEENDNVLVMQPSLGVEANVVRWFRIGMEGGYRFTTNVNTPNFNDQDLSSFFIGLRLKFGWSWGN